MKVRTAWIIEKSRPQVWRLLCDSSLPPIKWWPFLFGVPRPLECRLPDGRGGRGARRQCVSSRGVIQQRITLWENATRLGFRMEANTIPGFPVAEMRDFFELTALGHARTGVTRTTYFTLKGRCRGLRGLATWPVLKCIHRYVFLNWNRPL